MGPRAILDECGKSRPPPDSITGPSSPKRKYYILPEKNGKSSNKLLIHK